MVYTRRGMPVSALGALTVLTAFGLAVLASCAGLEAGTAERKLGGPVASADTSTESPDAPIGKPAGKGTTDTGSDAPPEESAGTGDTRGTGAGDDGDGVELLSEEPAPGLPAERAAGKEKAERTVREAAPGVSGLKAAFADDNKQYNFFVEFLDRFAPRVAHYPLAVQERIAFEVRDSRGRAVPNAAAEVVDAGGVPLCRGVTYAGGGFLFFPGEHGGEQRYRLRVSYNQQTREIPFDREGRREIEVAVPGPRRELQSVPLDLLFVLDTTGSMGEEIQRLKTTIEIINLNLSSLSARPRVRFGMVLYKDRGDEYVTRTVPFTDNLEEFQGALDAVSADGGGDTPEDLQSALQQAMGLDWNRDGIRLGFVVTDAPPHLDYGQKYTYAHAAREAKSKGIKIFSVGTGGLDLAGEYVLRQLSQYTSGKYIFLTYGESGESEGGAPGSVSHHTGANFQTDKLEAIIIRFAKEELANLTDQPLEQEEEYFAANRVPDEEREETLAKLFSMAVSQLVDYASVRLPAGTAAAVLPVSPAQDKLALNAEYFTEALVLSFASKGAAEGAFRLVERRDLQAILRELELQLSDLTEFSGVSSGVTRVGAVVGAQVLIAGRLYENKDGYELFLKLLRVETGEVLSVTKARIDRRLGLEA